MPESGHLEALRSRRAQLSENIREERKHAAMDDARLKQLKRERLALKDKMANSG